MSIRADCRLEVRRVDLNQRARTSNDSSSWRSGKEAEETATARGPQGPEENQNLRALASLAPLRSVRNRREQPWTTAITNAEIVRAGCAALMAAILVSALPASAEEAAAPPTWRVQTLMMAHRFMPDEPRADPDQASLRYALQGGRWKAMLGAGVLLVGAESDRLRLGLAIDGFVELINFDQGEPVPWESYRASVGFELLAESPSLSRAILPPGGRLRLTRAPRERLRRSRSRVPLRPRSDAAPLRDRAPRRGSRERGRRDL